MDTEPGVNGASYWIWIELAGGVGRMFEVLVAQTSARVMDGESESVGSKFSTSLKYFSKLVSF